MVTFRSCDKTPLRSTLTNDASGDKSQHQPGGDSVGSLGDSRFSSARSRLETTGISTGNGRLESCTHESVLDKFDFRVCTRSRWLVGVSRASPVIRDTVFSRSRFARDRPFPYLRHESIDSCVRLSRLPTVCSTDRRNARLRGDCRSSTSRQLTPVTAPVGRVARSRHQLKSTRGRIRARVGTPGFVLSFASKPEFF